MLVSWVYSAWNEITKYHTFAPQLKLWLNIYTSFTCGLFYVCTTIFNSRFVWMGIENLRRLIPWDHLSVRLMIPLTIPLTHMREHVTHTLCFSIANLVILSLQVFRPLFTKKQLATLATFSGVNRDFCRLWCETTYHSAPHPDRKWIVQQSQRSI